MKRQQYVKTVAGKDGKPIAKLPNGKVVLFKVRKGENYPPVGRLVNVVFLEEDDRKIIVEWLGGIK